MGTMIPTPNTNSQLPAVVLQRDIEGMAARLRADCVVVANEDGLIVAGSGSAEELDALAAISAFPAAAERLPMNAPVHAQSFSQDGVTLHLGVTGDIAPSYAEATAILRKILN